MVDTVLIPVDGSAASMKAVRFGADIAARHGARVVLLHVLLQGNLAEALRGLDAAERRGGSGLEGLSAVLDRKTLDDLLAGRRRDAGPPDAALEFIAARIVAAAEEAARAQGVTNVSAAVERGDPAKRILEHADKENADLIVMGARGLSATETLLLGSVSQAVCHLANRTCITVH